MAIKDFPTDMSSASIDASNDLLLFADVSDSNNAKKTTLSSALGQSNTGMLPATTNKNYLTDTEQTKLGYMSVTQAVNLDTMESDIAGKEPTISAGTTGQYWRGDKSWQTLDKTAVGLSNVDNTSDATKNSTSATLTTKTINLASNTVTGTKAEFNTACSDGNFLYSGDITQYTDEMAQDAIGAMVDTTLTYVDGTPLLQRSALTGDVTASAGSNATTVDKTAITGKSAVTAVGSDYVIISDTSDSGNLKKALVSDFGGGGTPGGSDKQLQFNDGGSFAGIAVSSWDKTTKQLSIYSILDGSYSIISASNTLVTKSSLIGLYEDIAYIYSTDDVTLSCDTGQYSFYNSTETFRGLMDFTGVTADRTYTLPNKDGTVAMLSDVSGVSDGDKGDITVSSSGAVWTIDNGVVSLAKQANVATGTLFYRKTAGTGVPEVQTLATLKTDLGLTGTNSGDQDLSGYELLSHKATDFTTINNTLYPTVQAVNNAITTAVTGLLDYRGSYDASTNLFPATGGSGLAGAILKGDFWMTSVGGTLGGTVVTAGDLIIALVDTPAQTAANWDLIAHNLGTYVTSITGTANQVIASGSTGAVTLSLPQSIATSSNPQFATLELGHATDTTIARVSAGVVSIEGVNIVTTSSTDTLTNKTLTAPKFADLGFFADANGNELIILDTVASAVNEVTFANAATGGNPTFTATGGDSNIGLDFVTKGTGVFRFKGNSTQQAEIRLFEDTDNGTNYVAIKGPASLAADYTLTLPADDGTANQVLTTDGSGVLTWTTPSSGGSFIGCRITKSSGQSYTGSTLTVCTFDTEKFDTDTMHDNVTNNTRVTFTTAGYYQVNYTFNSNTNAVAYSGIKLNGSTYIHSIGIGNSGSNTDNGTNGSFTYHFDASDYIELFGSFGATVTTDSGEDGPHISVHKVG